MIEGTESTLSGDDHHANPSPRHRRRRLVGSSLVRALVSRGDRVRVLDNFSTGKRPNLGEIAGDLEFVEGDLRDEGLLDRALAGTELVFHEAAIASVPRSRAEPLENHAVNECHRHLAAARGRSACGCPACRSRPACSRRSPGTASQGRRSRPLNRFRYHLSRRETSAEYKVSRTRRTHPLDVRNFAVAKVTWQYARPWRNSFGKICWTFQSSGSRTLEFSLPRGDFLGPTTRVGWHSSA